MFNLDLQLQNPVVEALENHLFELRPVHDNGLNQKESALNHLLLLLAIQMNSNLLAIRSNQAGNRKSETVAQIQNFYPE